MAAQKHAPLRGNITRDESNAVPIRRISLKLLVNNMDFDLGRFARSVGHGQSRLAAQTAAIVHKF
jgi:hypothetical protein